MPKFVPRERKHKVRQRLGQSKNTAAPETFDTNAAEIQPLSGSESEVRRQALTEVLRSQQNVKSSKKQKRLDKYIDKKLRKEENLDLIKRLASRKIDTSLFRASSSLGVNKLPRREVLKQALGETKAGINVESNEALLFKDADMEDAKWNALFDPSDLSEDEVNKSVTRSTKPKETTISNFGSGLKRPLGENNPGIPIVKKRRRRNEIISLVQPNDELPWDGFSSAGGSDASTASQGSQADIQEDSDNESDMPVSGEDSDEGSSDDESHSEDQEARKGRSSAFTAWATQQVNEAVDFTPSSSNFIHIGDSVNEKLLKIMPREPEQDPLPPELEVSSNAPERRAFSVRVDRSSEIQEARLRLPVAAEEQKIMEAVYNNPTVVIWGATGSGKTTQVPQFLYEAGFGNPKSPNPGMIGVTQPRRVAAVSMAKRVGDELGDAQDKVSYQIRFDNSVSNKTAVKFMTDGILIREITNDFSLSKYSVIIIDEAHERSSNTDILIGMLSRIVDLRATMSKEDENVKPLKLIIMSATLRITDFLENPALFRNGRPPLIKAEGRQYPVTTHFARRTQRDYVEEAFHKICKGHHKLPPGGMLVFLTGQNEITALFKKLKEALSGVPSGISSGHKVSIKASEAPLEIEDMEFGKTHDGMDDFEELVDEYENVYGDEDDEDFNIEDSTPSSSQVHILPLYSQLQTKDQLRVFQPPPENARLIVLATNVAETSLTIPGIRYVFDCGRAKAKTFDRTTGVQSFEVGWISKASASQRAGRAGRTGPGHCYRLYSSAIYERDFEEHAEAEILRMPVEGVVLQLKSMDLQHVVNFPFPTPPDRQSLAKAEKLLTYLGAISRSGKLTLLGRDLSLYPLSPRFAKMLSIGHQHNCMPHTIALVAALASPNLFIPENHLDLSTVVRGEDQIYTNEDRLADDARIKRRSAYNHAHHLLSTHSATSDALKSLTALCAHAHAVDKIRFCGEMFLSPKAVTEAASLFDQLSSVVHSTHPSLLPSPSRVTLTQLPSPSKTQTAALEQFVAAAFIDQIAILASAAPNAPSDLGRSPSRAIDVPYLPLFPITTARKASVDITDIAVYIHPSSLLSHRAAKDLPQYIVYHHLQRAAPSTIGNSEVVKKIKTRMHILTTATGRQLASLAKGTALLEYGKPIGKVEELDGGRRRVCWVVPSLVGQKRGGTGWPLPAVKVVQVKNVGGSAWEVESVIG